MRRLTQKRRQRITAQRLEVFSLNIFEGKPQYEAAIIAGYSPTRAHQTASRLVRNGKVVKRLQELRQKAEDASVMNVLERKQRLTEIARARLTDYQEAGLDGAGYISITKDSPNTAAIAGIESATKFDENGNTGTLFTKVKLHSPTQAIDLLNKMDKIYSEDTPPNQPLQVNVNVLNVDSRAVAAAILEANRLGLTPEILGSDGHGEDASLLSSPANIQATPVSESGN